MDVNAIGSITDLERASMYRKDDINLFAEDGDNTATFEALFQSALSMVNETNALTNQAEEEEIRYAVGGSESTVDLMAAQKKATLSLQYTITMRNAVIDAYKEIMNLSF